MTDLVVFQQLPSKEVIYLSGGADPIIDQVEALVNEFVPDISTEEGRKAIASFERKIASLKNRFDEQGALLNEDANKQIKAVNAERNRIWARFEDLQTRVFTPLEEYRNAEKKRIADAEEAIQAIEGYIQFPDAFTAAEIQERIEQAKGCSLHHDWREFSERANRVRQQTIQTLEAKLAARQKYEADQAELARLRKEQEERDAAEAARLEQERLDKIAADAAEKARKEAEEKAERDRIAAEQKAEADRQRLEKEKQDAIDAAAKAEADAKAAQEKHDREMTEAREQAKKDAAAEVERERKRQEDEAKAKAADDARRAADKAHKARIHGEALNAIKNVVDNCKTTDPYKEVVVAIAKGEIPHVIISY